MGAVDFTSQVIVFYAVAKRPHTRLRLDFVGTRP